MDNKDGSRRWMCKVGRGAILAGMVVGVWAASVAQRPAVADTVSDAAVRQLHLRSAQSTLQTGIGQPVPPAQALDQTAVVTAATAATPTLKTPYGVAVDSAGQIYVANLSGGVTVYNKQRQLIASITTGVTNPVGVAVGFGGNIYVANNGGNNVTIYNSAFAQIGTISDPSLQYPTGIFVDSVNDVWVLDGAMVHLYLEDGTPISTSPAGGATAIGPWGSNVTVWGAYSSSLGGLVEYVQNIGEALHSGIGYTGDFALSSPPGGEAQDTLGQQYTTDPNNNAVDIYNAPSTTYVSFNTSAPGYGIAVDTADKRFYVAEPALNQVVIYSTVAPYKLVGVIK